MANTKKKSINMLTVSGFISKPPVRKDDRITFTISVGRGRSQNNFNCIVKKDLNQWLYDNMPDLTAGTFTTIKGRGMFYSVKKDDRFQDMMFILPEEIAAQSANLVVEGFLTRDCKVFSNDGKNSLIGTLAASDGFTDRSGNDSTSFVPFRITRKNLGRLPEFMTKGKHMILSGRLSEYEGKVYFDVTEMQFLSGGKSERHEEEHTSSSSPAFQNDPFNQSFPEQILITDDDLPF